MTQKRGLSAAAAAAAIITLATSAALGFDLEAHRGGRSLLPENTLPAFANALSMGVDTLELDLGITKDGQVVLSHDRHLNPDLARDGAGQYVAAPGPLLHNLTLAEIQSYDVGQIRPDSDYAKRFAAQRAIPGTRMPTLAQVFALVRKSGNTKVRLNIETKIDPTNPGDSVSPDKFVAILLDLLARERFEDRVMIQSFDWRTLQLVQKRTPRIPTVYLSVQSPEESTVFLDKPSAWTAGFDPMKFGGSVPKAVKAAGGHIWSPHYSNVDAASLAQAHELGLPVVVWTVNDKANMGRLIDLGVDGIITDAPDLLRQVMEQKNLPLPAGAPVAP
jgi:glycerophosphoryl diester phosphodiesterase